MPSVVDWIKRLVTPPGGARAIGMFRTAPAAARYRRAAESWQDGQVSEEDVHPFTVAVMHWWTTSPGALRTTVDPLTLAYVRACATARDKRDPTWFKRTMPAREQCRQCGEPTTVERCAYCTQCQAAFGPCCSSAIDLARWDNGNAICPSCGEGELVG